MRLRLAASILCLIFASLDAAADQKLVSRQADLPRFNYPVDIALEKLVLDPTLFAGFGAEVSHNVENALVQYHIDDAATRRGLLAALAEIDLLSGRYAAALHHSDALRALQEKPADRLLSGLLVRAMVEALRSGAALNSDVYRERVGQNLSRELATMPDSLIENDIKASKQHAELSSETLILGNVRDVLQPIVDKSGAISSDVAPGIISARYALIALLPLKRTLIDVYSAYLAAHKIEKADIWAARRITLSPAAADAPIVVAIWDSGVDASLFPGRVVMDGRHPATIAFDRYGNEASGELTPIPPGVRGELPQMTLRLIGLSDVQSNIDSPAATVFETYLAGLDKDGYRGAVERIGLAGNYVHGTHVAGIAMEGNPFARLLIARIEFGYTLLPDPCPSPEQAIRHAVNVQAYVDFMKRHGARVTNMSWGSSLLDQENDLEVCGIGKTPDEREAIARQYFSQTKAALIRAVASAPDLLFIAAAGNGNNDMSSSETIPAAIDLPNLMTVGAADQAGDEAQFTNYGPTVVVQADGYQVDSLIPGGGHAALSGTSMAAPQVTNLAAKMLAVNPRLKPADVIRLIKETADNSADGRRRLIDPMKAVAAAGQAS